jgi:hypothetical protein
VSSAGSHTYIRWMCDDCTSNGGGGAGSSVRDDAQRHANEPGQHQVTVRTTTTEVLVSDK